MHAAQISSTNAAAEVILPKFYLETLPWLDTNTTDLLAMRANKKYKLGFDKLVWKKKNIHNLESWNDFVSAQAPITFTNINVMPMLSIALSAFGKKTKVDDLYWLGAFMASSAFKLNKTRIALTPCDDYWETNELNLDLDDVLNPDLEEPRPITDEITTISSFFEASQKVKLSFFWKSEIGSTSRFLLLITLCTLY